MDIYRVKTEWQVAMRYIFILLLFFLNASLSQVSDEVKEITKKLPLDPDGEVFIEAYKGSITITGWNKNEVEIYAEVYIDMDNIAGSDVIFMKDADVRISKFENAIYIRSGKVRIKQDILGLFEVTNTYNPYVNYRIKMPGTARLIIDDYKSKIRIDGLSSDVEIDTYKGRVDISDHSGAVDIETYKGSVRVEFAKITRGSMFETYKGRIRIGIPGTDGFELKCVLGRRATLHSDFSLNQIAGEEYDWERMYSASVNGGGKLIYIESQRGRIFIYRR